MRARWHTGGRRSGFTIVELLVVIGIIAVLIGLLFPALGTARARGSKMQELNALRQVGHAWNMYANQHNGAALPGFIDLDQGQWETHWRGRYEYPLWDSAGDSEFDLPDSRWIEPAIAGPWPWRLMEYLDYDYDTVLGYRDDAMRSIPAMVELRETVAQQPAFGYNALYVGGWLEATSVSTFEGDEGVRVVVRVRPRFWDAKNAQTGERVNVVVRSVSQIRRPSGMVVFSSSTRFDQPVSFSRVDDDATGSHLVTPPFVAEEEQWGFVAPTGGAQMPMEGGGAGGGGGGTHSPDTVHTFASPAYVPIGRHNRRAAIMRADGSVDDTTHITLFDQRMWINNVTDRDFLHTED